MLNTNKKGQEKIERKMFIESKIFLLEGYCYTHLYIKMQKGSLFTHLKTVLPKVLLCIDGRKRLIF